MPLQTGLTPLPKFVASPVLALTDQRLSPSCTIFLHNIKNNLVPKERNHLLSNLKSKKLACLCSPTPCSAKTKPQKNGKAVY